jgi:hypothetical protein
VRGKVTLAFVTLLTLSGLGVLAVGVSGASTRSERASARSLVVRAGDLTGDWTSGPPDAADDDATDKATAKCLGVNRNPNSRRDAHAEGPSLTRADGSDVQSSGNVFESRSALRASLSLFDRPRLATCFERLLSKQLLKELPNATIDDFTLRTLPVTIPGVRARGFRITVLVTDTVSGESATIVSDEILAWTRRLGSSATITAMNEAPANDLESEVARVLGKRLRAAA